MIAVWVLDVSVMHTRDIFWGIFLLRAGFQRGLPDLGSLKVEMAAHEHVDARRVVHAAAASLALGILARRSNDASRRCQACAALGCLAQPCDCVVDGLRRKLPLDALLAEITQHRGNMGLRPLSGGGFACTPGGT
jgi:hypothetical protein